MYERGNRVAALPFAVTKWFTAVLTSSAHKAATRIKAACTQVCLHTSSHFSVVSRALVLASGHVYYAKNREGRVSVAVLALGEASITSTH